MKLQGSFRKALILSVFLLFLQGVSSPLRAEINLYAGIIEPSEGEMIHKREPYIRFRADTSRFVNQPCCLVRLKYHNWFREDDRMAQKEWVVVRERHVPKEQLKIGTLFEIEPIIHDILAFNEQHSELTQRINTRVLTSTQREAGLVSQWKVELLLDDGSDQVLVDHEFEIRSRPVSDAYANAEENNTDEYDEPEIQAEVTGKPGFLGKLPNGTFKKAESDRRMTNVLSSANIGRLNELVLPEIKITSPQTNMQTDNSSIFLQANIPDQLGDHECCDVFLIHRATVNEANVTKSTWEIMDQKRYRTHELRQGVNYYWLDKYHRAANRYRGKPEYRTQNRQLEGNQPQLWRLVVNPLIDSVDKAKSDDVVIVLEPPETVLYDHGPVQNPQ